MLRYCDVLNELTKQTTQTNSQECAVQTGKLSSFTNTSANQTIVQPKTSISSLSANQNWGYYKSIIWILNKKWLKWYQLSLINWYWKTLIAKLLWLSIQINLFSLYVAIEFQVSKNGKFHVLSTLQNPDYSGSTKSDGVFNWSFYFFFRGGKIQ